MSIPTNNPRLTLRGWQLKDAPRLAKLCDPSVVEYMFEGFYVPDTENGARLWIAESAENPIQLAIAYSDIPCGGIGAFLPANGTTRFTAVMYYWVGKEYRRRGFAAAAIRAFVQSVFATKRVVRIEASVFSKNEASISTLESVGFTMEGNFEKAGFKNGELMDVFLFAKIHPNAQQIIESSGGLAPAGEQTPSQNKPSPALESSGRNG